MVHFQQLKAVLNVIPGMFPPPALNYLLQIPENALLTIICTEKVAGALVAVVMFLQILQMKIIWKGMRKNAYFSFRFYIVY